MRLPSTVYENLPYMYFLICGALLIYGDSSVVVISAALFYGAGSMVLVWRSANRRLDKQHKPPLKKLLPEMLYEYLPFIYGAIAVFLFLVAKIEWLKFFAFVFAIIALKNIILRHNNRHKKPRKL